MFRILVEKKVYGSDLSYVEAACNHEDTKLEGNYVTGSSCLEADTAKVFFFDEEADAGDKWKEA